MERRARGRRGIPISLILLAVFSLLVSPIVGVLVLSLTGCIDSIRLGIRSLLIKKRK